MSHDPLTEAIFGEPEETKEGVFVREDEIDALTEAIFARLDSSPARPHRTADKLTRESILREIEGLGDAEAAALEAQFISRPLPKRRAPQSRLVGTKTDDDWFQVRSTEKPITPSFKKVEQRNGSKIVFSTILLGLLVMGGILVAGRGDFFNFSSQQLEGASFSLLNAEQDLVFAPVARLSADLRDLSQNLLGRVKEEPGRKKELLASAKEAEAIQEILDEFFEANQSFSWLNVFRSLPAYPQALARLEEAVNRAETLDLKTQELRRYLDWLKFWEKLFARDGRYLVFEGRSTWAVLEISAGRASVHSTGRLSELNAALTAKLIPPPAVQTAKTSFDFYEAGWFLDSRTQSEIMARLFSATTQTEVDGVIIISGEVMEEFGYGLPAGRQDSGFVDIVSFLERTADWRGLERTLKNAIQNHDLTFFFRNSELEAFVEKKQLARVLKLEPAEDGLAVNLRSWEESASGWEIEAVEYSPEFFVDGSIVSKLNVRVKNLGSKAGPAYLKLYLPLASTLLEATGFGPRRPPPQFDYENGGFETIKELLPVTADSPKFSRLDFYKEQGFLAVGGWLQLQAGRSGTVTLEYRLPFRLNWRNGSDTYKLKVLKPSGLSELPFTFQVPISEEVNFEWLEPPGQVPLREDRTIQARIIFK